MIDMIPSEARNAVYSIIPTIISVLGIFIVPVAGILIEKFGLTAGIIAAFLVAFVGSIMISIGIHFQFQETNVKNEMLAVQPDTSATTGHRLVPDFFSFFFLNYKILGIINDFFCVK